MGEKKERKWLFKVNSRLRLDLDFRTNSGSIAEVLPMENEDSATYVKMKNRIRFEQRSNTIIF